MIDKLNGLEKFKRAKIDEENSINNIDYADDIMLIMTNDNNIQNSQKEFQELVDVFVESLDIIKLELNLQKTK